MTCLGIVVSRIKIVKVRFRIVVVRAVSKRIEIAYKVLVGIFRPIAIEYLMVAPCVVLVLYHFFPAFVKYGNI